MSIRIIPTVLVAHLFAFAVSFAYATPLPPESETFPIDVTIVQNQPVEIVRPNFFDPKHPKILELHGVLAGPAPGGILDIFFDWIDPNGEKQTSPVQQFPFSPNSPNLVDMVFTIPFCPQEVSVDFRLENAEAVRFVGNFTHTCVVPEPSTMLMAGLGGLGLILAARRRNR